MPTYLYECENCGRFEKFQKITDDPLKECPECQEPVRRIIGAPGVIFKGSGFYSTDSRTKKNAVDNNKTTESATVNKVTNESKKDTAKEKVS